MRQNFHGTTNFTESSHIQKWGKEKVALRLGREHVLYLLPKLVVTAFTASLAVLQFIHNIVDSKAGRKISLHTQHLPIIEWVKFPSIPVDMPCRERMAIIERGNDMILGAKVQRFFSADNRGAYWL